jgi:multidrug transporter EmrE-like cation transporter
MAEWSTYTLRDLLLFSARTYYRLFEIYNDAIRPAQDLAVLLGIVVMLLLWRRSDATSRPIAGLLAAGWLWTGVAFLGKRYAAINWSAAYFAWAFAAEAALLLILGVARTDVVFERPSDLRGRVGVGLFLFAVAVVPFVDPMLGRGWKGSQFFLLCPDPTAIGTLGLLLCTRVRGRRPLLLWIVPVLWCFYTAIFLAAMKSPEWFVAPLAAGLAVIATRFRERRDNRVQEGC